MSCTIAIIGSSNERSIKKYAKKNGIHILFDNGLMQHPKSKYRRMIDKADVVCIMVDAINHNSMYLAKQLAKEGNKQMVFSRGRGISLAIYHSLSLHYETQLIG